MSADAIVKARLPGANDVFQSFTARRFAALLAVFILTAFPDVITTLRDPCVVLSTSGNIPAAMASRLPFESTYGPIRVVWSEGASRWAELAQLTTQTQTARWLPRQGGPVEIEGKTIAFGLRTLRAGDPHLERNMKDRDGRPLDKGALRIATLSGFEQTQALTGEPFSLAVESRGGGRVIQVPFIPMWCWACERFSFATLVSLVIRWPIITARVFGGVKFPCGISSVIAAFRSWPTGTRSRFILVPCFILSCPYPGCFRFLA
jgi:hypothetical protein